MSTGVGLQGVLSIIQVKLRQRSKPWGPALIGVLPIRAGPHSVPDGQCRVREEYCKLYTVQLLCSGDGNYPHYWRRGKGGFWSGTGLYIVHCTWFLVLVIIHNIGMERKEEKRPSNRVQIIHGWRNWTLLNMVPLDLTYEYPQDIYLKPHRTILFWK